MAHPVTPVGSSIFKFQSFTNTNSVSATATQVTTTAKQFHFGTIQADPDNVPDMFVGDVTNQDLQLTPGQSLDLVGGDLSTLYFKTGTNGTAVRVNALVVY